MILGVDIGGTSAKLALLSRDGEICFRKEVDVCFDNYQTPILETVIRGCTAFLAERNCKAEGIAVSATGQIDTHDGRVIGGNGKIANYEGSPIKERMEEKFRVPVCVLNDANAAALGECYRGAAAGIDYVLMVTLGTGVGGGIVSGGKLYEGWRGIGGEIGQMVIHCDAPCTSDKPYYENYAATTALILGAEIASGEKGLTGRIILDRVVRGDELMQEVLNRWLHAVAEGLVGLTHIFNPKMIVIGGGISAQKEAVVEPMRREVLSRVQPRFAEELQIEAAKLGNDAGVIGAVKQWIDLYDETAFALRRG